MHVLFSAAVLSGGTAIASHPDAALMVDNDAGRRVEVYVNGHYFGSVHADAEMVFPLRSGVDQVSVRDVGGVPLVERTLRVLPGTSAEIRVLPPTATLLVANEGRAPLKVTVDRQVTWVSPGYPVQLQVAAGPTEITAEVLDRYGTYVVDHERLVAVPGRFHRVAVDDARLAMLGFAHRPPVPVPVPVPVAVPARWSPPGHLRHGDGYVGSDTCHGDGHGRGHDGRHRDDD